MCRNRACVLRQRALPERAARKYPSTSAAICGSVKALRIRQRHRSKGTPNFNSGAVLHGSHDASARLRFYPCRMRASVGVGRPTREANMRRMVASDCSAASPGMRRRGALNRGSVTPRVTNTSSTREVGPELAAHSPDALRATHAKPVAPAPDCLVATYHATLKRTATLRYHAGSLELKMPAHCATYNDRPEAVTVIRRLRFPPMRQSPLLQFVWPWGQYGTRNYQVKRRFEYLPGAPPCHVRPLSSKRFSRRPRVDRIASPLPSARRCFRRCSIRMAPGYVGRRQRPGCSGRIRSPASTVGGGMVHRRPLRALRARRHRASQCRAQSRRHGPAFTGQRR